MITDINISKNTSQFNNQIITQRLSCIPVYIDIEQDYGDLEIVLENDNDTDQLMNITTQDIKIRNTSIDRWSSSEDTIKIFPPTSYTKDFILLSRLKSKISNEIPGETLKLTAKFGLGIPKDNGAYNVVSTCAYGFTPDKILNHSKKQDYETSLQEKDLEQKDIDNRLENWDNHDYKRHYIETSFDFSVESVGSITETEIIKKACNIIILGLENIINSKEPNTRSFKKDEVAISNSFDITIQNIDYTLGKIIEYIIFEEYFKNQNILSFSGFIKPHPHDEHSIIRIAFKNDKDSSEENVESIIVNACKIGQRIYSSVYGDFDN